MLHAFPSGGVGREVRIRGVRTHVQAKWWYDASVVPRCDVVVDNMP